jgi:hypothetical protein
VRSHLDNLLQSIIDIMGKSCTIIVLWVGDATAFGNALNNKLATYSMYNIESIFIERALTLTVSFGQMLISSKELAGVARPERL